MTTDAPGIVVTGPADGPAPQVRECPHGPALVRGAVEVRYDGQPHPVDRPVVALCRCGKSTARPWCDSTHRAIPDY